MDLVTLTLMNILGGRNYTQSSSNTLFQSAIQQSDEISIDPIKRFDSFLEKMKKSNNIHQPVLLSQNAHGDSAANLYARIQNSTNTNANQVSQNVLYA